VLIVAGTAIGAGSVVFSNWAWASEGLNLLWLLPLDAIAILFGIENFLLTKSLIYGERRTPWHTPDL
jgi:hypothetical protein